MAEAPIALTVERAGHWLAKPWPVRKFNKISMMKKAVENHSKGGGGYIPKAIPAQHVALPSDYAFGSQTLPSLRAIFLFF